MTHALRSTWPLFLGIALIMMGGGLQSALLGVRAGMEGFATAVTGFIMSGYFAGFLGGSWLVPRLIDGVGHVRVFAALASLASTSVLVHAVWIDPSVWFAMRFLTGFCSAGLYIVAESWLNDRSSNEDRAQVLGLYMMVVLGAMGGGQFLLNLADPGGVLAFVLSSIFVSLALIPILLSVSPAPDFSTPSRLSILELYRLSPLGVTACFGIGLLQSMLWGLAAVYGGEAGFSVAQITIYGGAIFGGGMLFQWPMGRISDRYDRRAVLTGVLLALAFLAAPAGLYGNLSFHSEVWVIFLVGGLGMCCYSIAIAYVNDWLDPKQMVAASASLYFVYGVGATIGPFGASWVMSLVGPEGYYFSLASVAGATALFALYRMTRRPGVALDAQGPSVFVPAQGSAYASEIAAEVWIEEAESAPAEKDGKEKSAPSQG